jgi:hypothetical protein
MAGIDDHPVSGDLTPVDPQIDALRLPPHSLEAEESVIGAMLLSPEAAAVIRPLIVGGGQERGRRGGTQAVAVVSAFAAAAFLVAAALVAAVVLRARPAERVAVAPTSAAPRLPEAAADASTVAPPPRAPRSPSCHPARTAPPVAAVCSANFARCWVWARPAKDPSRSQRAVPGGRSAEVS